jgi:hypothetical protein
MQAHAGQIGSHSARRTLHICSVMECACQSKEIEIKFSVYWAIEVQGIPPRETDTTA